MSKFYDKSHASCSITIIKKNHILWKDENLHNKNAEEDQTGAGNIVFEGWQGSCSVLEELKGQI